jgi:hypothetical protein
MRRFASRLEGRSDDGPLLRAIALALAAHAALLATVAFATRTAPQRAEQRSQPDAWVEVSLAPEATNPVETSGDFGEARRSPAEPERASTRERGRAPAPTLLSEPESTNGVGQTAEPTAPAERGRRRTLDELGLDGAVARALILDARAHPPAPAASAPRDDIGGLRAGLRASDSRRGPGRSGPVVSEARAVALAVGPARGNAWFDVRADADGQVSSVTLVRFGSDGAAWQRVGQQLQSRLARHRLRVPEGAHGLRVAIRVALGPDAAPPADFKLRKGGGVQNTGPLANSPAAQAARDPSPRAQIYGREPAPSAQMCLECWSLSGGQGQAPRVSVELLGETAL